MLDKALQTILLTSAKCHWGRFLDKPSVSFGAERSLATFGDSGDGSLREKFAKIANIFIFDLPLPMIQSIHKL